MNPQAVLGPFAPGDVCRDAGDGVGHAVGVEQRELVGEERDRRRPLGPVILELQGLEVTAQTGPQISADIKTQLQRWERIVKASGYKSE